MLYDLIIIGGGPAGIAAGIYAARKKIKTLLITDSFGGQSIVASNIENFIGFQSISGFELSKILEEQLRNQVSIEIKDQTLAFQIEKKDNGFLVKTNKAETFETKTILLALGSRYRKLNVAGEDKFRGRGVFYCATCDAPLMKDRVVAIVGGGNSGFESAIDLLPYASKIYLLEYTDTLRADPITQEKVKNSNKVEVIFMAAVQEIFGDEIVKGLKYQDRQSGEIKELSVQGVFIAIGYQPNSEIVEGLVELNKAGEVIVDCKTQKTSFEGIWAAGDISDCLYRQNNIAIGDSIKAVLNIHDYLKGK
jgi:alkyl hydroperoxide reductase subunit F